MAEHEKKDRTLLDILADVGEDNLKYQVLSQCLDGDCRRLKNGTRLSFLTDEQLESVAVFGIREAVIVWVDRSKLMAAAVKKD